MIEPVVAGQGPTLLHPKKANELIRAINALLAMECDPEELMKLEVSERKIKAVFKTETLLVIRDGVVTLIECPGVVIEEFV